MVLHGEFEGPRLQDDAASVKCVYFPPLKPLLAPPPEFQPKSNTGDSLWMFMSEGSSCTYSETRLRLSVCDNSASDVRVREFKEEQKNIYILMPHDGFPFQTPTCGFTDGILAVCLHILGL